MLKLNKWSWFYGLSLFALVGCGATPQKTSLSGIESEYYARISDQTGQELHNALHDLIKGHKVYSYNDVFDLMKDTDEDPNNPRNVILFYTGESRSKSLTSAIEDERDGGKSHLPWNREHVWAKSQGFPNANMPPYTDLHHLRPADVKLNSTRSNLDFAEVPHGEGIANAPGNKILPGEAFEPADNYKGDVARMILYMDVRYDGDMTNEPDLVAANVNEINRALQTTKLSKFGNLKDLLKWHKQDPVDAMERRRNDRVFNYQHNRNPFIDRPELVEKIWGNASQP